VVCKSAHAFWVLALMILFYIAMFTLCIVEWCFLISYCLLGLKLQQPKVNHISFGQKVSAKATLRVSVFLNLDLTTCKFKLKELRTNHKIRLHINAYVRIYKHDTDFCIVELLCILKTCFHCLHILIQDYVKSSAMVIIQVLSIHYGFTMFLDKLHVFNVHNLLDTIIPRFQELYTKPSAVWIGRCIVNLDLHCILLLVMVTISWWNSKLNVKNATLLILSMIYFTVRSFV
jgi:hypothetical protein